MTNAKSRLVRIIALALAVLMIVPMALTSCKQEPVAGVDQAALDAALAEALQAAQAAQAAADKAAQDAKDAQDKLAEAEKNASDLQGQIDAMKNTTTTAAPATTTQAPVAEDTKVVDAYIASIVLDNESEYNKLVATYKALLAMYTELDAETVESTIATAEIAIRRAPSVDYVNQLVAALAADLDAIPTFSERVKEAYDAIDFASDVDVVDVVKAAQLAKLAKAISTTVDLKENLSKLDANELVDTLKAEVAALEAFGADELDLIALIGNEFYRYTGDNVLGCAITVKSADVLYKEAYDAYKTADIAGKIATVYGTTAGKELDLDDVVYGQYGAKDVAKTIEDAYKSVYDLYRKENAELKDAFEIAFAGKDYVLAQDGNYLRDALAAAKDRIAQLEAAKAAYAKSTFSGKLNAVVGMVDDPTTTDDESAGYLGLGDKYLYTNKKNVDKVYDTLVAWMEEYGFAKDDANLQAIIPDYDVFMEAKAYVDGVNEWAAKLEKIGADAIEELVDEYKDNGNKFGYSEYAALAQALENWYYGTYNDETPGYNADGVSDAPIVVSKTKTMKVSDANKAEIIAKVLDVTKADIEAVVGYYRNTLVKVVVKKADGINKDMSKITIDGLTLDSKVEIAKIVALIANAEDYLKNTIAAKYEDENSNSAWDKGEEWDLDSINADLINWPVYDEIVAAYNLASDGNVAKAVEIIKAYIAAFGTVTEEGILYDGHTYAIDPAIITIASYKAVQDLKAVYEAVQVDLTANLDREIVLADIDGEEVEFDFNDAVVMYRAISDELYKTVLAAASANANIIRDTSYINGNTASSNQWRQKFSYNKVAEEGSSTATYGQAAVEKFFKDNKAVTDKFDEITAFLGEYAPMFHYAMGPDVHDLDGDLNTTEALDAVSKSDGSVINVYLTKKPLEKDKVTYTYANAILSVDYLAYTTFSSTGAVTGFDKAGYYKAVNAALASYFTTWQDLWIKAGAENELVPAMEAIVEYAIGLGMWKLEDTFVIDEETYKFAIDTVGATAALKLYDAEGEEIETVKFNNKKYKIDFVLGTNVAITATEDAEGAVAASLATIVDDAAVLGLTYVYEVADYADVIKAALGTAPSTSSIKFAGTTYRFISATWFDTIVNSYAKKVFYTGVKAAYTAMTNLNNATKSQLNAEGQAKLANIYAEYKATYESPSFGGAVTVEKAEAALKVFQAEVNALLAKYPVAPAVAQ